MLPTPVAGEHQLVGPAPEVTLVPNQPVTVKGHQGMCPHAQRGHLTMATTARAISTTALGGGEAAPFSPHMLPSGASPPGRRAEGGWGDWAGQPAQPEQREGQRCEHSQGPAGMQWFSPGLQFNMQSQPGGR